MDKPVLLIGNRRILPASFPANFAENAGNMVHANAAFKIVRNAKFHTSDEKASPHIEQFVNEQCSKVVYIFANALKLGDEDHDRFNATIRFLKKTKKPIVCFGLGAQARSFDDIDSMDLSRSAIEMINILSDRSKVIGVRGDFTRRVLEKYGVSNVRVTGCPSLYSGLKSTISIPNPNLSENPSIAYSGTYYFNEDELELLAYAINNNFTHIEPVSKLMHDSNWACAHSDTVSSKDIPYYMKGLIKRKAITLEQAFAYVRNNYNVFRDMESWEKFNRENIDFSLGTRFHVNMASIISGVPALWITHDSRTRELCEFMNLPQLSIQEFRSNMAPRDLAAYADYSSLNKNYPALHQNFKDYLTENDLANNLE